MLFSPEVAYFVELESVPRSVPSVPSVSATISVGVATVHAGTPPAALYHLILQFAGAVSGSPEMSLVAVPI